MPDDAGKPTPEDVLGGEWGTGYRRRLAERHDTSRTWVDPNGYRLSDRIWNAKQADRDAIEQVLRKGIAQGRDSLQTAKDLEHYLLPTARNTTGKPRGGTGLYSARRLARTETTRAFGAATMDAADRNPFAVGIKWRLSASHPEVDPCDANAKGSSPGYPEGVYKNSSELPRYPQHPHCVAEGTQVAGPGVLAATSRRYSGPLCVIETECGDRLAVTPNHPVLTPRGWVQAGEIREGGDIVCCEFGEWKAAAIDPDDNDVPIPIEEIAGALLKARGVASVRVPAAPEHFHGDGMADGDVHVVGADGALLDDGEATGAEHVGQLLFGGADADLSAFPADGGVVERGFRLGFAPDGGVRVLRDAGAFGGGDAAVGQFDGVGGAPHRDSGLRDDAGDGGPADPVSVRQRLDGLARLEAFDDPPAGQFGAPLAVRRVRAATRIPVWHGHVYNLHTTGGWYIAGGIITHNCLCTISPFMKRSGTDKIVERLRKKYGLDDAAKKAAADQMELADALAMAKEFGVEVGMDRAELLANKAAREEFFGKVAERRAQVLAQERQAVREAAEAVARRQAVADAEAAIDAPVSSVIRDNRGVVAETRWQQQWAIERPEALKKATAEAKKAGRKAAKGAANPSEVRTLARPAAEQTARTFATEAAQRAADAVSPADMADDFARLAQTRLRQAGLDEAGFIPVPELRVEAERAIDLSKRARQSVVDDVLSDPELIRAAYRDAYRAAVERTVADRADRAAEDALDYIRTSKVAKRAAQVADEAADKAVEALYKEAQKKAAKLRAANPPAVPEGRLHGVTPDGVRYGDVRERLIASGKYDDTWDRFDTHTMSKMTRDFEHAYNDDLYRASERAKAALTDEERADIAAYKDGDYRRMNEWLRGQKRSATGRTGRSFPKMRDNIDAGLSKSRATQDGVIHRGAGINSDPAARAYYEGLEPGDVVVEKGYFSAATRASRRWSGDFTWEIYWPEGAPGMQLEVITQMQEEEFLGPEGLNYQVLEVQKKGRRTHIIGEWIPGDIAKKLEKPR